MTRFHVVFKDQVSTFGDMTVSGVAIDDGFKGIFDYAGDDAEFVEQCLNDDENVVSFSSERRIG